MSGPVPSERLVVQVLKFDEAAAASPAHAGQQECDKGMDVHGELTAEDASCMAVTAVAADLEYWARTVSVDGRVGLNDLTRVLDDIRWTSTRIVTGQILRPAFWPELDRHQTTTPVGSSHQT